MGGPESEGCGWPRPVITEILTAIEKARFEVVEGTAFVDQDVYWDGRWFRNCTFKNCRIFVKLGNFRLEGPVSWESNEFIIDGPATGIRDLLGLLGRQAAPRSEQTSNN